MLFRSRDRLPVIEGSSRKKDFKKLNAVWPCEQKKRAGGDPTLLLSSYRMSLFRMGNDVAEEVTILLKGEIKPPAPRYAGLPDALFLVVFLGPQRGMPQVLHFGANEKCSGRGWIKWPEVGTGFGT